MKRKYWYEKNTEVERILMKCEGMTADEAHEEIMDMRKRVLDGEDPEEILAEWGLEPDYVFDLLPW